VNLVFQDPGYRQLKDHLIESTGLAFYAERDEPLTTLVAERLAVLGLRNCSSYAEFLAYGETGCAEMDVLIAQLTIGETYFFRDEEQFAAIRDVILPDILARKLCSKQLLIWSAGCATGAEPYSLAVLLERQLGVGMSGWQIRIHATDLNRTFLTQAMAGKFRAGALRSTSDEVKRECFVKEGLTWTIHPRYKQWILFQQMNLMESDFSASFPAGTQFDLIVCRNVMIYFSREVNGRLVGQFHQSLGDGGWLVVGSAEANIDNIKIFRAVNAAGARLFQKIPPSSGLLAAAPEANPEPASTGLPAAVMPSAHAPASPQVVIADLDGLRQLADNGDWQGAAEYGKQLLSQNGLNFGISPLLCSAPTVGRGPFLSRTDFRKAGNRERAGNILTSRHLPRPEICAGALSSRPGFETRGANGRGGAVLRKCGESSGWIARSGQRYGWGGRNGHRAEGTRKNASGNSERNMKEAKAVEAVWRERAERLSARLVSAGFAQKAFPVLVLGVAKERYGIPLPDVAEVLPVMRPTPVPGAPAVFAGVINVHGEIRPVIDLRRFLGMEAAGNGRPRVVLLRKEGRELGLQIDSVEQIRWISPQDLDASGNLDAGWSRHVTGCTKDLLMLLGTEALFAELLAGVTN
jgi:chemotaxis protein methyltransferase CheR